MDEATFEVSSMEKIPLVNKRQLPVLSRGQSEKNAQNEKSQTH